MIVQVKFYFAELPNDMKMLAFLAGELSNSAKYFFSFATVSTDKGRNVERALGPSCPCVLCIFHPLGLYQLHQI